MTKDEDRYWLFFSFLSINVSVLFMCVLKTLRRMQIYRRVALWRNTAPPHDLGTSSRTFSSSGTEWWRSQSLGRLRAACHQWRTAPCSLHWYSSSISCCLWIIRNSGRCGTSPSRLPPRPRSWSSSRTSTGGLSNPKGLTLSPCMSWGLHLGRML